MTIKMISLSESMTQLALILSKKALVEASTRSLLQVELYCYSNYCRRSFIANLVPGNHQRRHEVHRTNNVYCRHDTCWTVDLHFVAFFVPSVSTSVPLTCTLSISSSQCYHEAMPVSAALYYTPRFFLRKFTCSWYEFIPTYPLFLQYAYRTPHIFRVSKITTGVELLNIFL